MRLLRLLIAAPLVVGLGWFGTAQYWGWMIFAEVNRAILDAPHIAVKANFEAYRAFPLASQFRAQLPVTLTGMMAHYQERATVTPEAADLAWSIGKTAGERNPALLIARAEYLINSSRWREIDFLPAPQASLLPEMNLVEAIYAALTGNEDQLRAALLARRCTTLEPQFMQLQILEESIPCVS